MKPTGAPAIGSAEWCREVQLIDWMAGDMDVEEYRTQRNEVAQAKRRGPCKWCDRAIVKGDWTWTFRAVDSDGFFGGRVCQACCDEYVRDGYGDDEAEE